MTSDRVHTFHIPVLGTGFTIDTPLRVARFGISSVMSLVDDVLIEQVRRHHCGQSGEPYEPIRDQDEDARARRITAWLNLVHRLVRRQMDTLVEQPFDPDTEVTRWFEMLPDSDLRRAYVRMTATSDAGERSLRQEALRAWLRPGSIDVNIMTKLDGAAWRGGQELPPEFNAAMSALRGFARSDLQSSIVFSAGMNPRLYTYAAQFADFFPGSGGESVKTIVVKVSDFRSALTQGRFLAKRGLWVSEFRIESGLNCGGHAFATPGLLMGPILEQFRERRGDLVRELHEIYVKALAARGIPPPVSPRALRVTAQGGIGTATEHEMLLRTYELDSAGWGTPFLLVPEATNVDDAHLEKLCAAGPDDVFLSRSSPLGVPFWNLRNSAGEAHRLRRIDAGRPGSPCTKGFLAANVEFTERPICTASRAFQQRKLEDLLVADMEESRRAAMVAGVLEKSCICHDLGGGAAIRLGIHPRATPAVCCGPNIVHFNKVSTLSGMIDHIYGRRPMAMDPGRPHMFVRELMLYVEHFVNVLSAGLDGGAVSGTSRDEFRSNLLDGIDYYRKRPALFGSSGLRAIEQLDRLRGAVMEAGAVTPGALSG